MRFVQPSIIPWLLLLLFPTSVSAQNKIIPAPDKSLTAIIIPVGNKGFEDQESRLEIRNRAGKLLRFRSFASADGEHGYGVVRAMWTADGEFFVFNAQNSGGHMPWHRPIYFYSRAKNQFYRLDDYSDPVTADFTLQAPNTIKTKRYKWAMAEKEEAVRVRLSTISNR